MPRKKGSRRRPGDGEVPNDHGSRERSEAQRNESDRITAAERFSAPIRSVGNGKRFGDSYPVTLAPLRYASFPAAMITLADPAAQARVEKLRETHQEIRLSPEEFLKITNWIDTNCQFYGSYHGRRNLKYRDEPDFRPFQTFEMAKDKKE